jgi:glucose-6-phosphate 1-dehydrogenase
MTDQQNEAHLFIAFGGTGDLMSRKLLPALYRLSQQGKLSDGFAVLGVARSSDYDDAAYQQWAVEALEEALDDGEDVAAWCKAHLHYQAIGKGTTKDFRALGTRIEKLEQEHDLPGNRTYYLALPPGAFPPTITGLGEAGLNESAGWNRIVVE